MSGQGWPSRYGTRIDHMSWPRLAECWPFLHWTTPPLARNVLPFDHQRGMSFLQVVFF